MADKVRAYDRLGNKIEVTKDEVGKLYALGGRVATRVEQDEHDATERQAERSEKAGIGGTVSTAVGAVGGALNPLMYSGGAGSTGEAYNKGVQQSITAGFSDVGVRRALDATAGPGAGAKYAQQADDIKKASPTAYGAGELMGLAGGSALPLTPAGAIGKAGTLAEGGANLLTKGLASRGVLGRAAATGIGLGARGAVEVGAYAGLSSAADDLVHDNEINGTKLYSAIGHGALAGGALGAGLGATGSLLASGVKAGAKGAIARLATAGGEEGVLAGKAKGLANEQAFKAVGAGFGQQPTRFAKEAAKYFGDEGGTKALGDIAIRHGVVDMGPQGSTPMQAAWNAAKSGHIDEMAPRIDLATDTVGKKLGDIHASSGASVSMEDVRKGIAEVRAEYAKYAGQEHIVKAIDKYEASLVQKLGGGESAPVQALFEQRKGLDQLVFRETKTLDPKGRVAALREVRGKLENVITDALDGASGRLPGELKAEYSALKKDYHGLRILGEMAEDSMARAAKGRTLSPTDYGAALMSAASGHPFAAPVVAVGHHVVRTRGNAAAAAFLTRMSERGAVAKWLRAADEAVATSAKGILTEEAPKALKAGKMKPPSVESSRAETAQLRSQAAAIMEWQGQIRANPKRTMDALAEASEVVGRAAGPRTASAYTSQALRALNYISRYVPVKDRRDPLDPRSVPPLSYEEADRLVRAHTYATVPGAVWKDFARGVITPEGLDWANEVPDQFAEFRTQLLAHVTDHMLRNKQLTQSHRLRIDKLLGTPAGPDLRPEAIARHQADFLEKVPDDQSGPQSQQTGGQPVNMPIQQSGFDSVEMRKAQ